MSHNLLSRVLDYQRLRGSEKVSLSEELTNEVRESITDHLLEKKISITEFAINAGFDASGLSKFLRKPVGMTTRKAIPLLKVIYGDDVTVFEPQTRTANSSRVDDACWRFLKTGQL